MLGPFATASRRYIVSHQVSLASRTPAIARPIAQAACDVHNDDGDNDNAWQRGPPWPHGMGPTNKLTQAKDMGRRASLPGRLNKNFLEQLPEHLTVNSVNTSGLTNGQQLHCAGHSDVRAFVTSSIVQLTSSEAEVLPWSAVDSAAGRPEVVRPLWSLTSLVATTLTSSSNASVTTLTNRLNAITTITQFMSTEVSVSAVRNHFNLKYSAVYHFTATFLTGADYKMDFVGNDMSIQYNS